MKTKYLYPNHFEVIQIDAWQDTDETFYYNNTFSLGTYRTRGTNYYGFHKFLKSKGIEFKKGTVLFIDDIDRIEIQDRKTGKPLFAAIYRDYVEVYGTIDN